MKKYMVQCRTSSVLWHYEYFDTENEALKYIDRIVKYVTFAAMYCKSRDGGYRLIKEF